MPLTVVGISHETAELATRERLAFAPDQLASELRDLQQLAGIRGGCIVSTCNRSELYISSDSTDPAPLLHWLAKSRDVSEAELQRCAYIHHEQQAARHLFRVASGLDSMVLGEPQILGQLKQAYQSAQDALPGHVGSGELQLLFESGFRVAKQVRTETDIGAHPVSVAFAATRLAQQIFADFSGLTALFIGAGETIELACRHLVELGLQRPIIANRTVENAQALATEFHGAAIALEDVPLQLPNVDIIISSTASSDIVLSFDTIKTGLKKRRHRPLFIVDLAVPRDIDPRAEKFDDVYLYAVDDLQHVIQEGQRSREQAAVQAEQIIHREVDVFLQQSRSRDAAGTIKALRERALADRDELLIQAQKTLENQGPEAALELLAHRLTNKLLHEPTKQLSAAAASGDTDLLEHAQRLFGLEN